MDEKDIGLRDLSNGDLYSLSERGAYDRGKLVADLPDETFEKDIRKARREMVTLIGGIPVGVGCILSLFLLTDEPAYHISFVTGSILLVLWLGLSAFGRYQKVSRGIRTRVYENGILVPKFILGEIFVPWGVMHDWSESSSRDDKKSFGIKYDDTGLSIPNKMTNYEEAVKLAKERIGDERYRSKEYEEAKNRFFIIQQFGYLAVIVLMVLTFGPYFFGMPAPFMKGTALQLVLFVTPAVILAIFGIYVSKVVDTESPERQKSRRIKTVPIAMMLVLMLVVASVVLTADPVMWEEDHRLNEVDVPSSSELVATTYVGEDLKVTGFVKVEDGQTLALRDTKLTFTATESVPGGIWVGGGGLLVLENATIQASIPEPGYEFEIHGSARISDSLIIGGRGFINEPLWVNGGVEVYSDDVTISNTTFLESPVNAILAYRADLKVENCTFKECRDAIETREGEPLIRGCVFDECRRGVLIIASGSHVWNNTFLGCEWGVVCFEGSTPRIEGNIFLDMHGPAVQYSPLDEPVLIENELNNSTIDDEGRDIVFDAMDGVMSGRYCWVIAFVIAPISIMYLLYMMVRPPKVRKDDE